MSNRILYALALSALACVGLVWLRRSRVSPPAEAAASDARTFEPDAPQLAPAPELESAAPARESAAAPESVDELAMKSDLPLLTDLAARPSGPSVEEASFARKYDAMPASRRRSAKDAIERYLRSGSSAGNLTAEEAAALSREIAWLEAHPGS